MCLGGRILRRANPFRHGVGMAELNEKRKSAYPKDPRAIE